MTPPGPTVGDHGLVLCAPIFTGLAEHRTAERCSPVKRGALAALCAAPSEAVERSKPITGIVRGFRAAALLGLL